jgi:hypothetical protein
MVVVVRWCGSCVAAMDLTPFLSANHQFKMIVKRGPIGTLETIRFGATLKRLIIVCEPGFEGFFESPETENA